MSIPSGPIRRVIQAWPALSFDPKAPAEVNYFWFNFYSALATGETVLSAVVTVTLVSGVDPNPAAMLDSTAAVENGYNVNVLIGGGIPNNQYLLTCTATTSNANHPVLAGTLQVANI